MTVKATPELAAAIGLRKAVPPEPARYAQCRNCKSFVYDTEEYLNLRGSMCFKKANPRCSKHGIKVLNSSVCTTHEFAYANRGDR